MKSSDTSVNSESILNGSPRFQELSQGSLFKIALIEPEIPQNTGNIGRTCVGTRSELHIVGKTGFDITDKNLKRAGLDYWQHLPWKHHESFADWQKQLADPRRVFYFSTKAKQSYFEAEFQQGDVFVFGKETKGLDEDLLRRNEDRVLKIPILGPIRSLNVATAVTVVLYEAIRQVASRDRLKLP
jgi:tRNA (cytidine/uridine-2'-O-)-methyltransferase